MREEEVTAKIKRIRKQKKMTLKDMSESTGFSISFLSQMERGISPITLTSLKKIAGALSIPVRDLFEDEAVPQDDYARRDTDVRLHGLQRYYSQFSVLSGHFEQRRLDIFHLVMEPLSEDYEESIHDGEEFYYVLHGKATFTIEGKKYLIKTGETIHFPSQKRHYVQNLEKSKLELLCVLTPVLL